MRKIDLIGTAVVLLTLAVSASAADARTYVRIYRSPYPISYLHNYGPGPLPGTFAYYDGYGNRCAQSSASYRGQDGRRHPCN